MCRQSRKERHRLHRNPPRRVLRAAAPLLAIRDAWPTCVVTMESPFSAVVEGVRFVSLLPFLSDEGWEKGYSSAVTVGMKALPSRIQHAQCGNSFPRSLSWIPLFKRSTCCNQGAAHSRISFRRIYDSYSGVVRPNIPL